MALSGLRLLALPVGRSGWPVLVPCRSWLFPWSSLVSSGVFSVSSEAGLAFRLEGTDPRTVHIFGQVPLAAAKPDGCFTPSILCLHYFMRRRFAPLCGIAALPLLLLRQQHVIFLGSTPSLESNSSMAVVDCV